ncbi:MAG: hypothetical protein JO322_02805 [Candidatus Eremiobacteraeota bacterium]|nr:hypothetical protein [Candidatus Eremiobacteraeota bacterium]
MFERRPFVGPAALATAALALLAACSGQSHFTGATRMLPALSDSQSTPVLTGHLYVANASQVQRFAISGGEPRSSPDLTYAGVSAPIALDASNDLYATRGLRIYVYPPGSTTPARSLHIARTTLGGVRSLAIDRQRHLYVNLIFRGIGPVVDTKAVLVYAANASGNAKPINEIIYDRCSRSFSCILDDNDEGGMAIDESGELLVASTINQNAVRTYASPATQSLLLRTLMGNGVLDPNGVAVDTSDELFVNNPNGTSSFVAVFPATASGSAFPLREISVFGAKSFGRGIATAAGRLFVTDPLANAVYEVPSLTGGQQTPTDKLSVISPVDVKLGR